MRRQVLYNRTQNRTQCCSTEPEVTRKNTRSMAGVMRRSCAILPQLCNLSSKRAVLCSPNFQSKRLLHVARLLLAGKVKQIIFPHRDLLYCAKLPGRSTWKLWPGFCSQSQFTSRAFSIRRLTSRSSTDFKT